jgi:excisionase family DNA binding protein
VNPAHLALIRAEQRLIEHLEKLEPHLDDGDPARWQEYCASAAALAAIMPALRPEMIADVLTQKELAQRLDVSTRTIRRRVKSGELPPKRAGRWAPQ